MPKRYYWIKLSQNFFGLREIKVLKKMENGSDYILFWQELLLASLDYTEETQKTGLLSFRENIPWSLELMVDVFGYSREIISGAMSIFKSLGMITVTGSGEMWANDIERLIGKESDSAERVRRHRAKIKQLESNVTCNVTCNENDITGNKICNTETEKDTDKKEDLEQEKEVGEKKQIASSVSMTEKQYRKLIDDFGEDVTRLSIDKLSNYKMSKGKQYKSDYHVILNWVIEEVTKKDNETVKAEKRGKDEEHARKQKIETDIEHGKMKKLPPEMTHGLINKALKKSDFINGKDKEDETWGFEGK